MVLHGGEEHEIATLDQTAFLRTVLQKQGHASASGRPEAPALPLIPAVPGDPPPPPPPAAIPLLPSQIVPPDKCKHPRTIIP